MKLPLLIPLIPLLSTLSPSSKILKIPRLTSLHGIAVLICAFTAGWVVVIISSAAGLNVFGLSLDFSKAGVFGDSFGGISAFMAACAAYFTYSALRLERRAGLRQRVSDRKRSRADQERDAEQTLFRLMELRNTLVEEVCVSTRLRILNGRDALGYMADTISAKVARSPKKGNEIYGRLYDKWNDELGHYFRLTYHIVRFADENFENWKSYTYIRLLRAQLSNSEQVLIALSCAYGEGREKFKGWVEHYALLHNIHRNDRERLLLDLLFEPSAFDYHGPRLPSSTKYVEDGA
jgi:hypothetical protein